MPEAPPGVASGTLRTCCCGLPITDPAEPPDRPVYVAVPPGGMLVIRVSEQWTPSQVFDYHTRLRQVAEEEGWPFRCAVVTGEELAVGRGLR